VHHICVAVHLSALDPQSDWLTKHRGRRPAVALVFVPRYVSSVLAGAF
jgi:hypothetical protein